VFDKMHELGIARDLFKIVVQKAKENSLKAVTKVRIKVGVASGIEEGLLRHSFLDHIFPGTIAEGAELELVEEAVETKCKDCGTQIESSQEFILHCPACGSFNIEVTKGKDVYLESIEGEKGMVN